MSPSSNPCRAPRSDLALAGFLAVGLGFLLSASAAGQVTEGPQPQDATGSHAVEAAAPDTAAGAAIDLAALDRGRQLNEEGLAAYRAGDHAKAAQLLAERAALPGPGAADAHYNAACSYALAGNQAAALHQLRRGLEAGLRNPGWIAADSDLASLHDDPAWPDLLAAAEANEAAYRQKARDPDAARLVTADLERFWTAFDRAAEAKDDEERRRIFVEEYLEAGSPGLLDFYLLRIHSADLLAQTVEAARPFLTAVRANTLRPLEQTDSVRAAFHRLKALHPDAVFPDVYFLIGRFNSGGTTAPSGLLIGVELFSLSPEIAAEQVPEGIQDMAKAAARIPYIVAHELIHYQQDRSSDDGSLLHAVLWEGGADFIADLIHPDGGRTNYQTWGETHAPRVAARFLAEKDARRDDGAHADWFYNYGRTGDDWFPDLGYYVGREIARGYYEQAEDKAAAVRALLKLEDPTAILAASGYAERFAQAPAAAAIPVEDGETAGAPASPAPDVEPPGGA